MNQSLSEDCQIDAPHFIGLSPQCLQEVHYFWILMPSSVPGAIRHIAAGKGIGFHLEIDLRVDMRRIERYVAEPSSDSVDVHPITKQMNRAGMPQAVGTYVLRSDRRLHTRGERRRALHELVNP